VGVYAEPKRYPAAVLVPGNEVSLKCLGNLPGPRYLDGRPADGSVGLAPRVKRDSGTKWRVVAAGEGAISLKCLGTIEGNRWLDGRTPDSSVGLAPNAEFPFTGARWQVLQEGDDPNLVHLRCLGHLQGPKFLDGNTTNGTVSLTSTLDPTGTKWEASLYPVNVGDLGRTPATIGPCPSGLKK
jgi:hypothetical protein